MCIPDLTVLPKFQKQLLKILTDHSEGEIPKWKNSFQFNSTTKIIKVKCRHQISECLLWISIRFPSSAFKKMKNVIFPQNSYFTVTLTHTSLEEHPLCSRIQDLIHTVSGLRFIILTLWDRLKSTLKFYVYNWT